MLVALLLAQALSPIAVVAHPSIDEMSGIVKSRTYPGVYWVHNDSGDSARIWPIKLDGTVVKPPFEEDFWVNTPIANKKEWEGVKIVNAQNVDWEDIAIDGDTLYVSDLGNNGNARRDLGVYVIKEPNPAAVGQTRALRFLPIQYPDQKQFPPKDWKFDCESVFVLNHKLYALTKHRKDGKVFLPEDGTKLYRLDTSYTDRPNVLTKLDEKEQLGGWVTAADVSPDGKSLAVLTQAPVASVWFFDLRKAKGDKLLSTPCRQVVLKGMRQCEAICFEDNGHVIVTNEQRDIFRIAKCDTIRFDVVSQGYLARRASPMNLTSRRPFLNITQRQALEDI